MEHHLQEDIAFPQIWEFEPEEVPSLIYCIELITFEELESSGFDVKFFLQPLRLLNCKSDKGVSKVILRCYGQLIELRIYRCDLTSLQ